MEVLDVRKFNIQGDIYRLEISKDDQGYIYKVYRNGELLAEGDRYSNALRVIITAYEIPAKEGRAYIMEGTEYQIIPNEDCCTLIYKYRIDSSYTMRVFDSELNCLNWILCGYKALTEELRQLTAIFPLPKVVEALEDVLTENDPYMLDWKIKIKVKCKED